MRARAAAARAGLHTLVPGQSLRPRRWDTVLTLLASARLGLFPAAVVIRWAIIDASWTGPDRSVCATISQGGLQPDGWSGACWAFVNAKFSQFMYGRYPVFERWRRRSDRGDVRGTAGAVSSSRAFPTNY